MIDLKPYYQVKLTLLRCKTYFLYNPPKTEDEKYAYDIIQKAYWINEKKMPANKVGRNWKFKPSEVDAWIKSGKSAE